MLRRFCTTAALFAALAMPIASSAQSSDAYHKPAPLGAESESYNRGTLLKYATQDEAQSHCPSDTVVWLNTHTGIWHLAGERWYGRTKHGAYVCEHEARRAGDRETRNGQ